MYLSTCEFAPLQRQAKWRDAVFSHCGEFELDFEGRPIDASMQLRKIGSLQCARLTQSLKKVYRTDRFAMRAQADDVFLLLQIAGHARLRQFAHDAALEPGDVAVIDAASTFEMSLLDRNSQICIHLPKDRLSDEVSGWEYRLGSKLSPSTSLLLHALVSSAFNVAECISEVQGEVLATALLGLLETEHGSSAEVIRVDPVPEGLQKVMRYIVSNLADEDLTPRNIASATAVSERHLHRIFNARGESVSQWIRRRRLDRCANDLRNPCLKERSITEIAYAWGFNDSAHFSRAFRKEFGLPPRDYRRAIGTH